MKVIGSRSR